MTDQDSNQQSLIDELEIAVDALTVENFAMRSQMKALEEIVLALVVTHPENRESMLEGYASRLKEGVGLIDLVDDMLLTEESAEIVAHKKDAIREHVNKILAMRSRKDLAN